MVFVVSFLTDKHPTKIKMDTHCMMYHARYCKPRNYLSSGRSINKSNDIFIAVDDASWREKSNHRSDCWMMWWEKLFIGQCPLLMYKNLVRLCPPSNRARLPCGFHNAKSNLDVHENLFMLSLTYYWLLFQNCIVGYPNTCHFRQLQPLGKIVAQMTDRCVW